jgi:hypothetical protein
MKRTRYAKNGLSILENLARRGNTWPQTCIEAIRDLDSALTAPEQQNPSILDMTGPKTKDKESATTTSEAIDSGIPFGTPQHLQQQQPPHPTPAPEDTLLQSATPLPTAITGNQWSNSSLIFGNQAMNNLGTGLGLGLPDFSIGGDGNTTGGEETFGIGDLWSLADGPWLIHESFDFAENSNVPYNADLV